MNFEIVTTTPEHILELRQNLRPEDEKEITCLGLGVKKVLWRSFKASFIARTALIDGKVAAVWGCSGTGLGNEGNPWLLTAPLAETIGPIGFAFVYRNEVRKMLKLFPILVNWVHADYAASVRLLKIVGFKLDEPKPLGPNGALFCRYEMRA